MNPPKPAAGSVEAAGGFENGPDLGSIDGSETGPEESAGLGLDRSRVFEDERPNSSRDGSGLSLVAGSDNETTEVLNLDEPWYSPFQDSLIWMMNGVHDLTALPWWLVISVPTLAFRVSLFSVLIFQLKKMQKVAELMPKLPPPLPPPLSGRTFREQYLLFQKQRREIRCPSYLWSFTFFIIQFPCFLLGITTIRRMCLDHLTGFNIYYKLYLDVLAIPLLAIGFYIPQGRKPEGVQHLPDGPMGKACYYRGLVMLGR